MKELVVAVLGFASFIYVDGKNMVVNHASQLKTEIVATLNKSLLPQGKTELFRIDKYIVFIEVQEVKIKEKE